MAFVLLIVEGPNDRRDRPKETGRQMFDEMMQFAHGLRERGILKACESLKTDTDAVRIESRGGKRSMIDGPFAEAKEMVGGFFLLDCATKEQALKIASECPATAWATVEVRETGPCHGD